MVALIMSFFVAYPLRNSDRPKNIIAFTDTMISYYEKTSDQDKELWFKRRYIKNKLKYAEHFRGRSRETSFGEEIKKIQQVANVGQEPNEQDARKHENEAKEKMQRWGVSLADPDEPALPLPLLKYKIISCSTDISYEDILQNGFVRFRYQDITVKAFYNDKKVVIRNESNEKALRLELKKFRLVSEDLNDLKRERHGMDRYTFTTLALNLRGEMNQEGRFLLNFDDKSIIFEFVG
jgi:hypothetical protein